jgi:exodeoxyribonuclease V alpha subunit
VIIGNMPLVHVGDNVRVTVESNSTHHPKFGEQFQYAGALTHIEDADPHKYLIDYLCSRKFRGVGRGSASRLVGEFGEKTPKVLSNQPASLRGVLPSGVVDKLLKTWNEDAPNNVLRAELCIIGLTPRMADNAVRTFGNSSLKMIREDPYCLTELDRVGFAKADRLASKLGFEENSPQRIEAATVYALEVASQDGHCYLPVGLLAEHCQNLLGDISLATIAKAILAARDKGRIILEGDRAYRPYLRTAELNCVNYLHDLMPSEPEILGDVTGIKSALARIGGFEYIEFSPKQLQSILQANQRGVSVITGGPGTGKTTSTRAICALWEDMSISYKLCAPTGRAAKRLAEATRCKASTIHRLLAYDPFTNTFRHNAENPIQADAVLIDEASMVDISMFSKFLSALPMGCRLVVVGDVNQLPSVGPGRILGDLIDSGVFPVTQLDRVYRQESGSTIVSVAHGILGQATPSLPPSPKGGHNCMMIEASTPKAITDALVDLFTTKFPKRGIKPFDVQILTPMRERGVGVKDLNPILQQVLNAESPDKDEMHDQGRIFRVGDRVMQIRNNYNLGEEGIFNGDIGCITEADDSSGTLHVDYEGENNLVMYKDDDLDDLVLAYAATIHKSQGCEFPVVIVILHDSHWNMLQNNLIYTAITRARNMCILIGSHSALDQGVQNIKQRLRYTGLVAELQERFASR